MANFGSRRDRPFLPKLMDEVQNVPGVSPQPIQFENDKLVALSNELHDRREFVSAVPSSQIELATFDSPPPYLPYNPAPFPKVEGWKDISKVAHE